MNPQDACQERHQVYQGKAACLAYNLPMYMVAEGETAVEKEAADHTQGVADPLTGSLREGDEKMEQLEAYKIYPCVDSADDEIE